METHVEKAWKSYPENPDEKTVQTVETQIENVNTSAEQQALATSMPRNKEQQTTRTTKRRRGKAAESGNAVKIRMEAASANGNMH